MGSSKLRIALFVLACCGFACADATAATPATCDSTPQLPAQRVFAKLSDADGWREYRTHADIPDLSLDGGVSADFWKGTAGVILVRTVEPGEDFSTYTDYCFGGDGHLRQVNFVLRTAWGWGFRLEGPVRNGAVHAASPGFFDTKSEKPIPRPANAADVQEALKPMLYLLTKQLPFSKLLNEHAKSASAMAR